MNVFFSSGETIFFSRLVICQLFFQPVLNFSFIIIIILIIIYHYHFHFEVPGGMAFLGATTKGKGKGGERASQNNRRLSFFSLSFRTKAGKKHFHTTAYHFLTTT